MDSHNKDDPEMILRKSLAALDVQRKSMEHEADAIYLELTTPPSDGVEPMGIDTPLVDAEGYPRGDIDIYRARTLRQRFNVLKTDHKDMSKKIEMMLAQLATMKNPHKEEQAKEEREARLAQKPKPKYDPVTGKWIVKNWDGTVAGVAKGHQRSFDNLTAATTTAAVTAEGIMSTQSTTTAASAAAAGTTDSTTTPPPDSPPFARVNAVAAHSPAEAAGLLEDDLIVAFGTLTIDNHNGLRAIAELVPTMAAEKQTIPITVLRKQQEESSSQISNNQDGSMSTITISLTPKPWDGRGLIGCHIVPYQ